MARTLQHSLAAVLVSTAVALAAPAAPAYAAKHHHQGAQATHHMKSSKQLSSVDMRERQITAQLNRDQLDRALRVGAL